MFAMGFLGVRRWSFGILLHEIMSMGELPYKNLANNTMVIDFIINGGVMERHALCAPTIYNQLILPCWRSDPSERIHFLELHELIQQLGGTCEPPIASSPTFVLWYSLCCFVNLLASTHFCAILFFVLLN